MNVLRWKRLAYVLALFVLIVPAAVGFVAEEALDYVERWSYR
jgi:hypothetical protein